MRPDRSQQAVISRVPAAGDARREIQRVGIASSVAITELQSPQARETDRITIGVLQRAQEIARKRIESID